MYWYDNTSDLKDVFTKIDKLKKLWDDGSMYIDLIRYLPGMAKISRLGQIGYTECTHKEHMPFRTGLIEKH